MLEPKTHYEQVPLEVVRKLVEEQILREITTEHGQGAKNIQLDEYLLGSQEESTGVARMLSKLEI